MLEANPFQRNRGEKRTAFVADLATGDFAWEYEATKDPSPWKQRNWFQFSTADQVVLNAAYDAAETQATLRHPKSGNVLVINFQRLEPTNMTSGQVRALQVKDGAGKIVRSWDLEVYIQLRDAKTRAEFDSDEDDANLDVSQRGACVAAYERCATFVQGPPGTGKTGWAAKTLELLQKIEEFEVFLRNPTEEELSMLAVAPTHIAVDTLLERVLKVAEDSSTGKAE